MAAGHLVVADHLAVAAAVGVAVALVDDWFGGADNTQGDSA